MFRPSKLVLPFIAISTAFGGCKCIDDMAADTTSRIIKGGKPALNQENDYDLAARALPGTLKTIESFHYYLPGNKNYTNILAEAYCQYGSGFAEDEWEVAQFEKKDFAEADYQAARASKMFVRCMGYSWELLPKQYRTIFSGDIEGLKKVVKKAGKGDRTALMWLAVGVTSLVNMNRDDAGIVSLLPYAEYTLRRLVVMDGDRAILEQDPKFKGTFTEAAYGKAVGAPKSAMARALPHFALGRILNSRGKAMGGNPEQGRRHFERAIELTDGKFLLAKVYLARDYCRVTQNRELFHKTLVEVLQTDPAIWPEERLANEIARRRARRYLKMEKEWF